MTKSIEMMWKEGFVNEANLTAPKINDLYNRKSQNIVDKLLNMFELNIKAVIVGSLIMLVMMSLIGAPFLGLYICCLLAPLLIIAKKELKNSVNLSKGQSSYDYLMAFNDWLKNSIERYSGYYKVFYPLFFLGMAVQAIVSKAGGKVISLLVDVLPTDIFILGQPYYLLVAVAIVTLIFARSAETIYHWDLNLVYGRQFKKLDELIADMEELRK
ncbi:hypothetical protein [Colwellia hornerae]|uniref:Uncharacterized protein n=1 Tax=Colwellia hornerae TaxID=89402 RepID=A0A5C6Q7M1_9GAMM|nr:hypothetical protein [Colwellia hornerae]TWX50594.1 hypothetical protein ESZ28_15370 [Colwellia hornerae]TWX56150.1 hypothetical protein ESZ26_15335 [Colwellia hornerae]TWX64994.1 hypothetical protein ESZ27_13410 [Colwellia hornerae]